jgi:hypothetical protein
MTTTIEIELHPGTNDYTPSVSSGLGLTTSPLVLKANRVQKTKVVRRPTPVVSYAAREQITPIRNGTGTEHSETHQWSE